MIIVTPYLVQPVNANQIALPTDGYRTANDGERILLGQEHAGRTGEARPEPQRGSAAGRAARHRRPAAARRRPSRRRLSRRQQAAAGAGPPQRAAGSAAQPGFTFVEDQIA